MKYVVSLLYGCTMLFFVPIIGIITFFCVWFWNLSLTKGCEAFRFMVLENEWKAMFTIFNQPLP